MSQHGLYLKMSSTQVHLSTLFRKQYEKERGRERYEVLARSCQSSEVLGNQLTTHH